MNLEKHISSLLYRYDCVIVPQFGGFLTQKQTSEFNPISHEFTPPTKELRFNASLKAKDGLLIHYISQVENLSFDKVHEEIQTVVKNWKTLLSEGKKLSLDSLGSFLLNDEGNLVFTPLEDINYAKDSFGLTPIKAHYILRDKEYDLKPTYFSWKRASMVAAGIAFIALAGTLGYSNKDQVKYQMANMFNPNLTEARDLSQFISHEPSLYPQPYKVSSISIEELALIELVKPEKEHSVKNTVATKTIEKKKAKVEPIKKRVITTPKIEKYQLISGAFKNHSNANKKLKQLKAQGFKNAHILGNLSGMIIVSYNTYSNKQKAQTEVNRLKSQDKEVWLRTKK